VERKGTFWLRGWKGKGIDNLTIQNGLQLRAEEGDKEWLVRIRDCVFPGYTGFPQLGRECFP